MEQTDPAVINQWLGSVLAPLNPGQRRRFFRQLASDLQRSQSDRIKAQQNPDGSAFQPRKPRQKKGAVRQRAMFARIRNRKNLRRASSAEHAEVGFNRRMGRIAEVHQHGLVSEVSKGGPLVKYAQRQLLGLSAADIDRIEQSALQFLQGD
ncbi:MAG: phage virion morphogenesis protein [Candidatus Reddybacter sp.]